MGDRKRLQREEKPRTDSNPLQTKKGKREGIIVPRHRFIALFAAERADLGKSTRKMVRYSTRMININFNNLGNRLFMAKVLFQFLVYTYSLICRFRHKL